MALGKRKGDKYFILALDRVPHLFHNAAMRNTEGIGLRLSPKLKSRMEKRATKMMMTPSAFIRWCVERMLDSLEWGEQMQRDVKSGKMKKLYGKEI